MMIDVENLLDQAFLAYNSGYLEKAEELLNAVQQILPSHGDYLYLKGLIALKKNILSKANESLSMAVQLYPQKEAYQEALADVYRAEKKYDKANEIYNHLKQTDTICFKKALIEKEMGNTVLALLHFKDLLSTREASNAYLELALLDPRKKLSYLKKSFALSPSSKNATEIVKYLLEKHAYKNLDEYLKYITDDYILACVDSALGKYESAKNKLKNYLNKNPYEISAWILNGQIYEELNQFSEAEEAYQKALALDPKSFNAHYLQARLLMTQGRFSEALDHYQIICRMDPENKEILLAMALLTEHTKNYSEAIGLYFRLLSLGQKNLVSHIQRNILKLSEKDPDLAKKFALGWVKSFPNLKSAKNLLKKLSVILLVLFFSCPSFSELSSDEKQWQILWESKMAETGDPISLYNVGELFEKGEKVPKNLPQAVHYYEKSAAQSYLPACVKLGKIFATEPLIKDDKKSIQWYTYAAEKGDIQSAFYVADYYQQRSHEDLEKAKNYLEKALKQTFPNETDYSKVSPQYATLLEKTNRKNDTLTERKIK